MPNILLTDRCIRSCPYCFAKQYMGGSDHGTMLQWEDLIYIADFLEASKDYHISLLGGEPSLHPLIIEYVIYLLERGFHVNIFTSGIFPGPVLRDAESLLLHESPDHLSFVVNMNDPQSTPLSETRSLVRFLESFGQFTNPGFNIYTESFDLSFLVAFINQYGLKRHIRLGLAHPIPGKGNTYLAPSQLKVVAEQLLRFEQLLLRFRVSVGLDCGFPLCMFTDEQIGHLFRMTHHTLTFGCGPAIDIGPDMNVWSCFPLSEFHRRSLYDFDDMEELLHFYQDHHGAVRTEISGIYGECDACHYREEDLCAGGCIAHALSAFAEEEPVRLPGVALG